MLPAARQTPVSPSVEAAVRWRAAEFIPAHARLGMSLAVVAAALTSNMPKPPFCLAEINIGALPGVASGRRSPVANRTRERAGPARRPATNPADLFAHREPTTGMPTRADPNGSTNRSIGPVCSPVANLGPGRRRTRARPQTDPGWRQWGRLGLAVDRGEQDAGSIGGRSPEAAGRPFRRRGVDSADSARPLRRVP
jgi:hypothetical protein